MTARGSSSDHPDTPARAKVGPVPTTFVVPLVGIGAFLAVTIFAAEIFWLQALVAVAAGLTTFLTMRAGRARRVQRSTTPLTKTCDD